jgi:UDP-GlcNAc3NAcA epimerase
LCSLTPQQATGIRHPLVSGQAPADGGGRSQCARRIQNGQKQSVILFFNNFVSSQKKMIKLLNIVGARPQIIKAAAISRCIKNHFQKEITDIIVHTGQHYDYNMSSVFFEELEIPEPAVNLGAGSSSHAIQTAEMIVGLEKLILEENPDVIVLYGDTNSTLAGSLAASKKHYPVAHIEAGLRSHNKSMPEEINRIVCDHTATLLFCPTVASVQNLQKEGFRYPSHSPFNADNPGIFHCGDIMYDNSLYFAEKAEKDKAIFKKHNLHPGEFVLITIHRDYNTENPERMNAIFSSFNDIAGSDEVDFIIPLHPRTVKALQQRLRDELSDQIAKNPRIKIIEPVSYLNMILLEKNASMIMTDSGGVQKEAYFFEKPSLILRSESEWVELIESGNALIVNADREKIMAGYEYYKNKKEDCKYDPVYGDGNAARIICEEIVHLCN